MDDRSNYTAAKELLAKSRRILISGHLSPDGDIGSSTEKNERKHT